jgi:hypothetical protein
LQYANKLRTPALYFQYDNGTVEIVPQVGGMLAYYNPVKTENQKVEAYPAGFRMIAGNNKLRTFYTDINSIPEKSHYRKIDLTQPALAQKAIGFNCLNYKADPEAAFSRHEMPKKSDLDAKCLDGLRAEVAFPSCWNGEVDSDNHQDHVAYPSLIETGGTCPKGYERRLPTMLFETKWKTNAYIGVPGQFVWANGDPTGFAYHADYIMGWNPTTLQNAIDGCTNPSGRIDDCPIFSSETQLQTETDCTECRMEVPEMLAKEDCAGPMAALCGGVKISAKGDEEPDSPPVGYNGDAPAPAEQPKPSSAAPPAPPAPTSTKVADVPSAPSMSPAVPELKPNVIAAPVNGVPGASEVPQDAPPAPTSVMASAPVPAAPVPTQAPALPPAEALVTGPTTLFRTVTAGGRIQVEEVVYVEQVEYVTVTAPAPPPQKYRRHAHSNHIKMHRRDREHGALGHKY